MGARITQRIKSVPFYMPKDATGADVGGAIPFISLKNYPFAVVNVMVGNLAADATLTLKQAKNVEGGSSKALNFAKLLKCQTVAGAEEDRDKFIEEAVTNNSYTLANASQDNHWFKIEVSASMLDVNGGFDCFRPNIAAGAGATLLAVWVDLFFGRSRGDEENVNIIKSALRN
jgi:hypothetical protein